jgi:hypothetical protein
MTASTKIGEMPTPRHSQVIPSFSTEVQDPRLVQYLTNLPEGIPQEEPKKKGRGFKFWKKSEKVNPIEAY